MGDLLKFTISNHNDAEIVFYEEAELTTGDALEIYKTCGSVIIGNYQYCEDNCLGICLADNTEVLVTLSNITSLKKI